MKLENKLLNIVEKNNVRVTNSKDIPYGYFLGRLVEGGSLLLFCKSWTSEGRIFNEVLNPHRSYEGSIYDYQPAHIEVTAFKD